MPLQLPDDGREDIRDELDVTVETRGRDHVRELVAALQADGFKVRVLEGADD